MSDFTFSEHGEDILVHRLLLWKEGGFYVDCGSYHSRHMSMTARLRSFGWTGINIDIDEQVILNLQRDIPGTTSVLAAISNSEEVVNFYRYADPVLNTICDDQYRHLKEIEDAGSLLTKLVEKSAIKTTTLDAILKRLDVKDYTVDYLNLDIEGAELPALQGFPWERQDPAVITVEVHRLDLYRCEKHPLVSFLDDLGYVLQSYVFHTAIFCKKQFDTELCHRVPFSRL